MTDMTSNPPRLAIWLLQHLCSGDSEPLTGDLIERFREGQTRGWFWRQVLAAVALSMSKEIRHHWLLGIRAVIVGKSSVFLSFLLIGRTVLRWSPRFDIVSIDWWLFHMGMTVLAFAIGGWCVAYLHRAHRAAMVLVFGMFALLSHVISILPLLRLHLVNSIDQPRFRPYFAFDLGMMVAASIGVFLGALLTVPSSPRGRRTHANP
jgi:hypothetical protein